jgi:hypothetical protein
MRQFRAARQEISCRAGGRCDAGCLLADPSSELEPIGLTVVPPFRVHDTWPKIVTLPLTKVEPLPTVTCTALADPTKAMSRAQMIHPAYFIACMQPMRAGWDG